MFWCVSGGLKRATSLTGRPAWELRFATALQPDRKARLRRREGSRRRLHHSQNVAKRSVPHDLVISINPIIKGRRNLTFGVAG
eukprot:5265493-Amphidinium_carterae.1